MSASVFTGVGGKFELNGLRKTTHKVRIRRARETRRVGG